MNESTVTKGFIGLVAGVLSYLAGCMNEIVIILALLVIMDYILGIAAVFMHGCLLRRLGSTMEVTG
jgi:phage-related holin